MSIDEAFAKWYARQDHSGLPWQTSRDELFNVFFAGWSAKAEALKQTDLFPGTWAQDLISAPEAQPAEQSPCKGKVVDSTSTRGSIHSFTPAQAATHLANAPHDHDHMEVTAEMIYEAWPVKKARGAAIKAIQKAMKQEKPEALLQAVRELAGCYAKWPVGEKQYLPMCSTFMNQERWSDDRSTWRKGADATTSQFSKTY